MAVVATLNILTKVSTGELTAGLKKATSSLQEFGKKAIGVGSLFKAAVAFFSIKHGISWISDSMKELAKSERGAYNTVEAFKAVEKLFKNWGQVIARELAPYLEVAAKGLMDLLNNSMQFGKEAGGFKDASDAIRTMVGYLATAAQTVTLVFQAFASGIYTMLEGIAKLIGMIAKLDKKLPKNMQLGIADDVQGFVLDIQNAAKDARDKTEKTFNDLATGNTWGKQLEEAAKAAREKAIKEGPVPLKPTEPAAPYMRDTKEAYSAALKADRMMKQMKTPEQAELEKLNKNVQIGNKQLQDINKGIREKREGALAPANL